MPPPNLAALVALSQFDDPKKQPVLVPAKGWDKVYSGLMSGRCMGGVFPASNLQVIDKDNAMRVLYKSAPVPEQALSAGPRVSPADQAKIAAALVAPEALEPTEKLRATAKGGDKFISANNAEYAGLARLLKKEWGFYDN
jgi:ABC-type phosphate/phosphonate transport system substrate-binding protein